jgi:hypothetical protein
VIATKAGSDAMGPISTRAQFDIAAQAQSAVTFSLTGLTFNSSQQASVTRASGGSGNGDYSYSATGPCTLTDTPGSASLILTRSAAGTCVVTATRAASGIYASANIQRTLQIDDLITSCWANTAGPTCGSGGRPATQTEMSTSSCQNVQVPAGSNFRRVMGLGGSYLKSYSSPPSGNAPVSEVLTGSWTTLTVVNQNANITASSWSSINVTGIVMLCVK